MGWFDWINRVPDPLPGPAPTERESKVWLMAFDIGAMTIPGKEFPRFLAEQFVDMQERIAALEEKQASDNSTDRAAA